MHVFPSFFLPSFLTQPAIHSSGAASLHGVAGAALRLDSPPMLALLGKDTETPVKL